jgi:hypothetical protein
MGGGFGMPGFFSPLVWETADPELPEQPILSGTEKATNRAIAANLFIA